MSNSPFKLPLRPKKKIAVHLDAELEELLILAKERARSVGVRLDVSGYLQDPLRKFLEDCLETLPPQRKNP